MRRVGVALALTSVAAAAPAPVVNEEHRFELAVGDGWDVQAVDGVSYDREAGTGLVARWSADGGARVLVVSRVDGPGSDAWRGEESFFDGVEAGVQRSAPGYRRLKRKVHKLGRVPALDLWFRYDGADGRAVAVAMRFLFFRSYALTLAVDVPADDLRAHRRAVRKLVESFKPYFKD